MSTHLPLPAPFPSHYENIFTGEVVRATEYEGSRSLSVADLFATFPVALLRGMDEKGEEKGGIRGQ